MFGGQGSSGSSNEHCKICECTKSVNSLDFQYSEFTKYLACEDVLVT